MTPKIIRATLTNQEIRRDDQVCFSTSEKADKAFSLKAIYHHLKIDYPKFFKMSSLAKVGFLAAEVLLQQAEQEELDEMDVVLASTHGCLESDTDYQKTIDDALNFFPSPALFVYTLPNIVIGEICIRHKIYGDNTMYILPHQDWHDFCQEQKTLFQQRPSQQLLLGYVDVGDENYFAELLWIKK